MRKTVATVSAVTMLLASGCAAIGAESEEQLLVIAADLELSGDGSALGSIYRNALELRVDQINERGLLPNRRLELQLSDNRTDSGTAAGNIAELADDDAVTAIITGGCAACILDSIETVNSAGVPTIALAGADSIANPASERPYVFKVGPNALETASLIASELSRSEVETVAIVASDDEYGEDGMREVSAALQRADIEVVVQQRITDSDESRQAAAAQVTDYDHLSTPQPGHHFEEAETNGGPDATIVWAYAPLAGDFAAELHELDYAGELYLDMAAAEELFLTGDAREALANATMVFTEILVIDEVIATSPAKTARKAWFNDYSARYGTYHAFASFAADAVDLIVAAVNQVDSIDRDAVRTSIETTRLDGLTGPLRMNPQHHSGLMAQSLETLVVRGDRWRLAG